MELRELGEHILFASSLEDKLYQPDSLSDEKPDGLLKVPQFPSRPTILDPSSKQRSLFPKDNELNLEHNRGAVLHFFANHELLAMELMALALLKFPYAPRSFRMGIAQTIAEEQEHLKLYIARMNELGIGLGDIAVNDFFWNSLKTMRHPMDYVSGMSLTFEQANLDYCIHYIGLMKKFDDHATAQLLQTVYDDEIGHVKYGVHWFDQLRPDGSDQWEAYRAAMHGRQPLSIARAKGIGFDRDGRLKAGLSSDFVEEMDMFSNPKGRCPRLYWYNADCELEIGHGKPGYSPSKGMQLLMSDFELLPSFAANSDDAVLCMRPPSINYRRYLKDKLGKIPEFVSWSGQLSALPQLTKYRSFSEFQPWGWTSRAKKIEAHLDQSSFNFKVKQEFDDSVARLFQKSILPELRASLRDDASIDQLMGPEITDGLVLTELDDVLQQIEGIHSQFQIPAVVKSIYGFSGAGQCRIYPEKGVSESQKSWIAKQLKSYGKVVVEPWLQRELDGSVLWNDSRSKPQLTVFASDLKGRYCGHHLGPLSSKIPEHLRPYFLKEVNGGPSRMQLLLTIGETIQSYLEDQGYQGYAGIDFFVYFWPPTQTFYLRALCEINCRMTMGHVALGIDRKLNKNKVGRWQTFTSQDIRTLGFEDVLSFAKHLEGMSTGDRVVFTNDPETALGALSCLITDHNVLKWIDESLNETKG